MNADRLLALYERIADAPDAVARLRRFVLNLAVRGKLVPQDAKERPAPELITLTAKSKLDQANLPRGWRKASIGSIFDFQYGKGLKASERLNEGLVPVFGSNGIVGFTDKPLTDRPAIIVGRKGSAGALKLCAGPSWTTDVAYFVEAPPFFELRFALNAFAALDLDKLGKGVKPGLSRSDVYELEIACPPLVEQHRIVAKLDELMGLCDHLEAARASREAVRDRLAAASLARLVAPNPITFQADTSFTLDALSALTARPDQIKAHRQIILSLAVRGELVPQNTSDEPASKLLVRIAQEVADYTKINRIGQVQAEPITERDLPFAAPDGWRWTRLISLFKVITDGDHQPPPKADEGVAFLTIGNITTGHLDFAGCRLVPEAYFKSLAAYRTPAKGDILYTVVGATYGRPALVETDRTFCVQRHIAILKPVAAMSLRYLLALLASPLIYDQATRSTTGTAQPTIALRPLRNFLVPLPPLAEQHRIVAKVDALMALCDRLEAALTAADSARARLLDAVLAEALSSADDSSGAITVEPSAAAASPGAAVTTERSAFVLLLAYERHRFARRDRTFGHVKAEKILHLVEAEAGLDLGRAPFRDAAGPNDFRHLLGVDRWAKQHRRYAFEQKGKGYTFERLADFQTSLDVANTIDAPTRVRVEKIIDLFVPMDKQDAELFATLYAAWNNLLIEGKSPDDADILRAAREDWHPDKLKISRNKFAAALRHLKASEFIPSGRGKFVPPAPQRDLFLTQ